MQGAVLVEPPGDRAAVGERGPELISTGAQPLNVTSNEQSKAMLSAYSPGNSRTYGDMDVPLQMSFETTQFAGEDYVTKKQLEEATRSATMAGAKRGEAMTLARLQNSRSSRAKLGL